MGNLARVPAGYGAAQTQAVALAGVVHRRGGGGAGRSATVVTLSRVTLRIVRIAALVACGVLVVAGCSDGDDGAAPSGTVSPSPTSTPTPTAEVPDIPMPELPAAAEQHTPEGSAAFVTHLVTVINRAYLTGDTASIAALGTPDCPTCLRAKQDIDAVYARGNVYRGGQITLVRATGAAVEAGVIPTVPSAVNISALDEVTPAGDVVESFQARADIEMLWDLVWRDDKWLLEDVRTAPR